MIFLVIVRRCVCVVCNGIFDLKGDEFPPQRCRVCNSPNWEFGPDTTESVRIRTGRKRVSRVFNPGAKNRDRQQRGKRQWQQFHGERPKSVESDAPSAEN